MRRLSLSTLLIGINVGLVLCAVLCVVAVGAGLLRRLADSEGLDRARLAVERAVRGVDGASGSAAAAASLLAERPALRRLLDAGGRDELGAYLEQFRKANGIAACAIVADGVIVAQRGEPLSSAALAAARSSGEDLAGGSQRAEAPGRRWFFAPASEGGALLMGASAAVPGGGSSHVVVALVLDEAFTRSIEGEAGAEIRILARRQAGQRADEGAVLRARALAGAGPVVGRLEGLGIYQAASPLRDPSGEVIGIIQASLAARSIDAPVQRLVRALLLVSALVAGLAILSSFLLARRLARPLEELTLASARIGRGDLSTPIHAVPGAEAGTLAETMEEMRGRLLQLTAELRRRQADAEAILSGIAEGVFSVDRERRIRYLNPQTAALLGIEPARAIGRFCGEILRPDAPDGVRPCEDRCPILHARFRGSARGTETLLLADGRRRTVVITSAMPAAGESGGGGGDEPQFQVMRDETEIEAIRRSRDAILANISHEFRTPLSAQLASIELLRDRLGDLSVEETRGLVLSLERGALKLTQLIDNLLESVRIEAGRIDVRLQPVALDEVVEEAVEMTSALLAQRRQTLAIDLPFPLPLVRGDSPRLVQVFVNLLANANKFSPNGSTIRVAGTVKEGGVLLWVEDEGPGLPPGDESSIFDRFVRSPGSEPEQGGLGLGLWIVKSIVERHGGRVEARGGAGGDGTRMCVFLPIEPARVLSDGA